MKKVVIAIIIASVVGIGIGTGVYLHNKDVHTVQPKVTTNQAANTTKDTIKKVSSVAKSENKESVLSIFKKAKSISAVIAGNINVTMLPDSINGGSNGFMLNEYYNQYSNQIMNLKVESLQSNLFTMHESQNGQATGIYNLKFNTDKTQATGTFENVATGKKSPAVMSFSESAPESSHNSASEVKNTNSIQQSEGTTIGVIRKAIGQYLNTTIPIIPESVSNNFDEVSQQDAGSNELMNLQTKLMNEYGNDQLVACGDAGITSESSKLVGKPQYRINGENAYLAEVYPANIYFDNGHQAGYAIVSASGHYYTRTELDTAVTNGNLKELNSEGEYVTVQYKLMFDNAGYM